MTSPDEILDGVIRSVKDADILPDQADYLKYEADQTGENSDLRLPLFQIEPVTVDYLNTHNTSEVGRRVDSNGNDIGRIYHSEYEMSVDIELWIAAQSMWNASELGNGVRRLLYRHDSESLGVPLPTENYDYYIEDDDGTLIRPDDVWKFSVETAERVDDTTQSPTLRRWQYEFEIGSYDVFETEEAYIEAVTTPTI